MSIDPDRIFERSRGYLSQADRNKILNNPDRKEVFDLCGQLAFMSGFFTQEWLNGWASKVVAMDDQCVLRIRKITFWLNSLGEVIARHPDMAMRIKSAVQSALETGDLSAFSQFRSTNIHLPTVEQLAVPEELTRIRDTLAPQIYRTYKHFRTTWEQRSNEIRAIWSQIPIEERRKILEPTQFPGMNRHHRLDFLSIIQHDRDKMVKPDNEPDQRLPEMAYECPTISIEDFESGSLLITLMESRATSPPHLFVWQEFDSLRVSTYFNFPNHPSANLIGMIFPQSENGEHYGDVIPAPVYKSQIRHNPRFREAFEWYQDRAEKQEGHAFSTFFGPMTVRSGLSILFSQDKLYRFLWTVSQDILRWGSRNSRSLAPVGLEPQPETILNENVELEPLVRLFEEYEYRSPQQLDMSGVLDFIAAKVEEKKSFILSLREHPGIFAARLRVGLDHNALEQLAVHGAASTAQATSGGGGGGGKARRHRKGKGGPQLYVDHHGDALATVIFDAIADCAIWTNLCTLFQKLDQLLVKYAPVLANINGSIGDFIPPELSDFTARLVYLIRYHMAHFLYKFRLCFASSVGYRDLFIRSALRNSTDKPDCKLKFTSWNRMKNLDPLVLMVDKLTFKSGGEITDNVKVRALLSTSGAILAAKEIRRRLIGIESYAPDNVTQRLKQLISEISALGACWIQIFQLQPWAQNLDFTSEIQKEFVYERGMADSPDLSTILEAVQGAFPTIWTKHKIDIPNDFGRRTEDLFDAVQTPENTKDRQQSEEKLRQVWDAVQEKLKEKPELNQLTEDIFGPEVSTTRNWEDLPELNDPPLKIPLAEEDPYDDFLEDQDSLDDLFEDDEVSRSTESLLRLFRGPGDFESGIKSPQGTDAGNDPTAGLSAGWWAGILSSLGKYVSSKPDPTQVARGSSLGSRPGSESGQDATVAGIKRPAEDLEEEEERGRDRPRGRRLDRGQPVRKKVKTRGVADPTKATEPVIPAKVTQAVRGQAARRFPLSRRDCETMNYFFFQPSQTDHSGHIPWRDFVHAMTNIGFQVTADGGSVHTFRPPRDWNLLPINIHAPHGHDRTGKLRYNDARRIGNRLTNIYQMHPDQFVET